MAFRLMTVEQTAKMLGVSPQVVYRLANDGQLPAVRINKVFRFLPDDVMAFIGKGGTQTPKKKSRPTNGKPPRTTNGSRMATLRVAQGLTQRDLSELSGVSQAKIHRMEAGEVPVLKQQGDAVAQALYADYDDLFNGYNVL